MDIRWTKQWRQNYDAEATRLWNEMALRVERDVRIFNGLEPAPQSPEQSDDLDPLTEQELEDVGDLGEAQE